jgi:hypothetical protein
MVRLPEDIVRDPTEMREINELFNKVFERGLEFPHSIFRWQKPVCLFAEIEFGVADFAHALGSIARHYGDEELYLKIDRSGNDFGRERLQLPWYFSARPHELSELERVIVYWPEDGSTVPNSSWVDQFRWIGSSGLWGGFGIRPAELFLFAFSPHHPLPDLQDVKRLGSNEEVKDLIGTREADQDKLLREYHAILNTFK